jgi:riboflavin synthase alpha subunit
MEDKKKPKKCKKCGDELSVDGVCVTCTEWELEAEGTILPMELL